MEDGVSPVYQRAVKNGISDGIARGFKNDLHKFKEDYRRIKEDTQRAAVALNQLGGVIYHVSHSDFMYMYLPNN